MRLITMLCLFLAGAAAITSCKKNDDNGGGNSTANLVFKFQFDSTQERQNAIGQPSTMPAGRAGQSPRFKGMSVHYIELAPGELTLLGGGKVLYKAAEVNTGGANAIDFSKALVKGNGEVFFSIPIKDITPGSYKYLRASLAYQNYDVTYKLGAGFNTGTVASFIGYRTYIGSLQVKNQLLAVNANKDQGFWAFETVGVLSSGQAPPGATTVPNPIFATSPIPAGSCVVTGHFLNGTGGTAPLVITGNETQDVVITMSLSTNKSFEWTEVNPDGFYEPLAGEGVVDMGIRGMKPFVNR
jgi:hypothetical protein